MTEPDAKGRLDGWKRIAKHLNRHVRTVRRWEKDEGLPVRRLMHDKQASVYAYRSELDAWLAQRDEAAMQGKTGPARRPAHIGARLLLLTVPLLIAVALVVWHWQTSETTVPKVPGEWDWVLISEFDNRTGEEMLDGAVEYALQRELANSSFVNVAPRARVNDVLQLMKLPPDTQIDAAIGREISMRDGDIRFLINGRIEKLGGKYLITAELVNPADGVSLASVSTEAVGQAAILDHVGYLAKDVRAELGESVASIEAGEAMLEKVSTPSLYALKLFSEANRVMASPERHLALAMLEEAVRVDPDFASAHLLLWYALNERGQEARATQHLENAMALAEKATERERLFILATYYYGHLNNETKAIETYEVLLRIYPDHFWANGNLANHYESLGRLEESYRYRKRNADWRPNSISGQIDALQVAVATGDRTGRKLYLERIQKLPDKIPYFQARVTMLPVLEAWVGGEYENAVIELDKLVESMTPRELISDNSLYALVRSMCLALGRLQRFKEISDFRDGKGWFEVLLDFDSGNPDPLYEYLEIERLDYFIAALHAMAGQEDKARAIIDNPRTAQNLFLPHLKRHWEHAALGQLALSEGRWEESVALFADYSMILNVLAKDFHLFAMHSMAQAYVALGRTGLAIDVLETARRQKNLTVFDPGATYMWQRNQVYLHELYRAEGRYSEAQYVAMELRDALRAADANHPFLSVLDEQ